MSLTAVCWSEYFLLTNPDDDDNDDQSTSTSFYLFSFISSVFEVNGIGSYCIIFMKYNSSLFNKFLNTINQNTNNNNNTQQHLINSNTSDNSQPVDQSKVSPSPTASSVNMAAVINNTPVSSSLVTCTRFTDEYDMKEELGK